MCTFLRLKAVYTIYLYSIFEAHGFPQIILSIVVPHPHPKLQFLAMLNIQQYPEFYEGGIYFEYTVKV